jgi:hypothetical protein
LLTRTLSILALGAGLALTTAACSSAGGTSAAGTPTAPAAPTTAALASTTPAPTAVGGSTTRSRQGCPVSRATLVAAWRAEKIGGEQLKHGATLGEPECYAGYVLVTQTSVKDANGKPVADDEVATFKYESSSWKYQGASSADYCEGMPATTRTYFKSHFDGGCGG